MKSYSSQEVIRILKMDGWYEISQRATDHKQFKHPAKSGKVTIPHPLKDVPTFILKDIEKKTGVKFK